jgi:hypothetical protein
MFVTDSAELGDFYNDGFGYSYNYFYEFSKL